VCPCTGRGTGATSVEPGVAHSAAAARRTAAQSSALPRRNMCHIRPLKQPKIEASPLYGEVLTGKIKTSPLCGQIFYCATYGRSCVLGPLGGGDMNCLYRDVRMRRRRALGLALCQPVKHVVVTLRCGCAPSAAARFKNYSAFILYAKMFWHKVWAWVNEHPQRSNLPDSDHCFLLADGLL
jgi:hypothetical protein